MCGNCKNYAVFPDGYFDMSELQFEHEDGIGGAEIDSIEASLAATRPSREVSEINFDTRRKIENLLEERALRKLLENDYDF